LSRQITGNRLVVLDTETTGLNLEEGHQIIEIGGVEIVDRRLTGQHYQQYLKPDREVDRGAVAVHGITNELLADKPRFADIVDDFMRFIEGAELIIHNAPFDVGFIDAELQRVSEDKGRLSDHCRVLDTLALARQMHPGQKNTLDALCKRYGVDNSHRDLHGALLDAQILAEVYLTMTGGQATLSLEGLADSEGVQTIRRIDANRPRLRVIRATEDEVTQHIQRIEAIDQASGGHCLWKKFGQSPD
jgi:DNA polymerase-3 subunit epsilon